MSTVFTRRFEADWICSQVPRRLMHLEGLYDLFVSKFAYSTLDLPTNLFKVQFAMRLTYNMLPHDDYNMKAIDAQNTNSGENLTGETSNETLWDNDCPWSEWYSAEDPVKGFELITIWSKKMVESSLEMDELENASPYEAEKWLISPSCPPKLLEGSEWNQNGFASRLHILVDALKTSFEARFMGNFVSGVQVTESAYGGNRTSRAIKGAPLESLFAQFCLHSLWFCDCNIRAIAVLWMEFVREVRRCWEESQLIPRMTANGSIDLSTCLINQKLQMLAVCIEKKCEVNEDYQDCIGSEDQIESITENFSTLVVKDRLASDMSAFKAANPNAVFEDFIRCHSPGDWIDDDLEVEMSKDNPSPRGKLSERMSENGNSWRNIWSRSPALPVSGQKPLLDPNREGEKVLQYLETLQPHQLLEQMLCTAFGAAADTLIQTNYGELKQMESMMQHLYLTLAPALKPLQENRLSPDSETIEDLRRLCIVFQHVEKLLTLAASLHRKFLQAPRLAREIFSDFYNFYIPRLGIGLVEEKEFDKKQAVWNEEREAVANMFVQPTANQSWRKVLSMGNLLNGHEPIRREIIFSVHGVNGNHYAIPTATVSQQNVETYRMYICGTSNDLRVALSVVSCD